VQFTQQLATMINSGLPLSDALELLRFQSKPAMARVLGEVSHDIQGGASLADAMAKHGQTFNKVYVSLVRVGELAGKLDEVLLRLAENEEKAHEFNAKAKGALIYPIIVTIAMIGVVTVMMVFVVPQLTTMYDSFGAELPFLTQILIAISNFMRTFWWLFLIILGGAFYFLGQWRKTTAGRKRIDTLLLKVPIIGPLRTQIVLANFSRTLALLVGAGVSILEGLGIVADTTDNAVFEEAVKTASKGVEKGMPLAAMLAKQQVFPPILPQMIAVGEETGELEKVLNKVAHYFQSNAENLIKNLTTAIEPIIMVVLGGVVAFIVMAIIMPLYQITELF
jgi:type IV pilus assembly protein PilC